MYVQKVRNCRYKTILLFSYSKDIETEQINVYEKI